MAITPGKYSLEKSFMHRVDPRVKLLANITIIVLIFLAKSLFLSFVILVPIFLAFSLSKIEYKKLLSMLKPVLFIGIFLFIINMFIINGATITYFHWKFINITKAGLRATILVMIRVYIMIIATTILTMTTKPNELTIAIEDLLLPLRIVKFPVHIIAMIIAIALRFIPSLLDEAQRIMKAQASRGVDFKNGGLKSKAKSLITLIIPLFVTAFNKAEDLGNAMETRGYDPYEKRTRYRQFSLKFYDLLIFGLVVSFIVLVILTRINIVNLPVLWF